MRTGVPLVLAEGRDGQRSGSEREILWPAGARLIEVALFCDTDETGSESVAYFSDVVIVVPANAQL